MPSAKPRINVLLDQHVYDAVKEFSLLAGVSMSSIVSDMLTANVGTFKSTSMMLGMAKAMQKDALAAVKPQVAKLEQDAAKLEQDAGNLMEGLGEFVARFGGQISAGAERASEGAQRASDSEAADGSNPLAINKGVRSGKNSASGKQVPLFLASSSKAGG